MSGNDDGGGPPREFLRRGTGSQKFSHINYLHRVGTPNASARNASMSSPPQDARQSPRDEVPHLNFGSLGLAEEHTQRSRGPGSHHHSSGRSSIDSAHQDAEVIHMARPDSGYAGGGTDRAASSSADRGHSSQEPERVLSPPPLDSSRAMRAPDFHDDDNQPYDSIIEDERYESHQSAPADLLHQHEGSHGSNPCDSEGNTDEQSCADNVFVNDTVSFAQNESDMDRAIHNQEPDSDNSGIVKVRNWHNRIDNLTHASDNSRSILPPGPLSFRSSASVSVENGEVDVTVEESVHGFHHSTPIPSPQQNQETAILGEGTPQQRMSPLHRRVSTSSSLVSSNFHIPTHQTSPPHSIRSNLDSSADTTPRPDSGITRRDIAPHDLPLRDAFPRRNVPQAREAVQRSTRTQPSESTRVPASTNQPSVQHRMRIPKAAGNAAFNETEEDLPNLNVPSPLVTYPHRREEVQDLNLTFTTDHSSDELFTPDLRQAGRRVIRNDDRHQDQDQLRIRTLEEQHRTRNQTRNEHPQGAAQVRQRENMIKQMRNGLAHLDVAHSNLRKARDRHFADYNQKCAEYEAAIAHVNELTASNTEERDRLAAAVEKHKKQVQDDRMGMINLEQKFKDSTRKLQQVTKERDEAVAELTRLRATKVDGGRQAGDLRIKLRESDTKLKETTEKSATLEKRLDGQVAALTREQKARKRDAANWAKEKKDLELQLNEATRNGKRRSVGIQPRTAAVEPLAPRQSDASLVNDHTMTAGEDDDSSNADQYVTPAPRRVQFHPGHQTHLFDNTFDTGSNCSSPRMTPGYRQPIDRNTLQQFVENSVPDHIWDNRGECYSFFADGIHENSNPICRVFRVQHGDGHSIGESCGATVYKYDNFDVRWIYKDIQVYYYGYRRLVVTLPKMGIEIRCYDDQMEIIRPDNEITAYFYETGKVVEQRKKRRNGYFAYIYQDGKCEIHGSDDRPERDCQMVSLPSQRVPQIHNGNIWTSREKVKAEDRWKVTAFPGSMVQVNVVVDETSSVEVVFNWFKDVAVIRHLKKDARGVLKKTNCWQMGKAVRDREKDLIFYSCDSREKIGELLS